MKHLTGSCLCGNVQIRVSDQFQFIGYCHCSECRKWSGSAFATGGMVGSGDLEITSDESFVSTYRQSEDTELCFCRACGSSLFSRKPKLGGYIVRLGALDEAPSQQPNVHIFTASKAPWFELTDQLEKFEQLP